MAWGTAPKTGDSVKGEKSLYSYCAVNQHGETPVIKSAPLPVPSRLVHFVQLTESVYVRTYNGIYNGVQGEAFTISRERPIGYMGVPPGLEISELTAMDLLGRGLAVPVDFEMPGTAAPQGFMP